MLRYRSTVEDIALYVDLAAKTDPFNYFLSHPRLSLWVPSSCVATTTIMSLNRRLEDAGHVSGIWTGLELFNYPRDGSFGSFTWKCVNVV